MVMGSHSQAIHDRSVEPHLRMIEREELRKHRLAVSGKLERIYCPPIFSSRLCGMSFYNCSDDQIFWLVGAAIFSQLEGWTYFDGLYFCMIFFLTIGYVLSFARIF